MLLRLPLGEIARTCARDPLKALFIKIRYGISDGIRSLNPTAFISAMTASRFPRYGADSTIDAVIFSHIRHCEGTQLRRAVPRVAIQFARFCIVVSFGIAGETVLPAVSPSGCDRSIMRTALNNEIELLIDVCIRAEYRS